MNDELAKIRERYEREAAPHNEAIAMLSRGVHAWCEVHRNSLTQDRKVQHANMASGEIKWRQRPGKVIVRSVETVLETLNRLNLVRFIRVKEEVNKEAILAEPEAVQDVKGISISKGEDFVIVPFETALEEVAV